MEHQMRKIFTVCILFCHLNFGFSQDLCGHYGRFRCRDGSCISQAKVCNGVEDCHRKTDERGCTSPSTCSRNLDMARANNYFRCRKPCTTSDDCQGQKRCVCDDECGMSCVNPNITCDQDPPNVANAFEMVVKRVRSGIGKLRPVSQPYKFGDVVAYACSNGYRLNGPYPRCNGRGQWSNEVPTCIDITCRGDVPTVNYTSGYRISRTKGGTTHLYHPRDRDPEIGDKIEYICDNGLQLEGSSPSCGENLQWSNHTVECTVPCVYQPNEDLIFQYGVQCGQKCKVSSDCSEGQECVCGAVCSMVCADPEAQCPDVPTVANAVVTYNGTGMHRVARYQCRKGYYLHSGTLALRCSSAAVWIGTPPVCRRVHCGNPYNSIERTEGAVLDNDGTQYGSTVSFFCRWDKNLYGSKIRQCKEDGLWSGELTVCDYNHEDRCHHPGIPINGQLFGRNFSIGATVRFECDDGFVLYGSNEQTCIINGWDEKQWSGGGAPACKYYKYPQGGSDALTIFTSAISQLPEASQGLGRSIDINDDEFDAHDVYFVIDISDSVIKKPRDLEEEIAFAKRLVERMKHFRKSVYYGVMIFASRPRTILSLTEERSNHNKVIKLLDSIHAEALKKRKSIHYDHVKSGTATYDALLELRKDIATARISQEDEYPRKTHVFIFTDGQHNEGPDPRELGREFDREFGDTVEFYSITACCDNGHSNPARAIQELKDLTFGKEENFIQIKDYYQMSSLLDKVTNVKIDYSKCGIAGDVGTAEGQTSLGRSVGGVVASENAWPWYAAIAYFEPNHPNNKKSEVLKNRFVLAGSILNKRWILTAAHEPSLQQQCTNYAVFVGAFMRYSKSGLPSSIKAYEIEYYIPHPDYSTTTFNNDIALIKIGREYNYAMHPKNSEPGLTFDYYVRPVCLPCSGSCQVGAANEVDTCQKEENLLRREESKTVVSGFGHTSVVRNAGYNAKPSAKLRQVLLRIANEEVCTDGITAIRDASLAVQQAVYNENTICTYPKLGGNVTDACKGDSGGPMVREMEQNKRKSCWIQIGIVSFGFGCGSGEYPGYFTNVARYVTWINQTMESDLTEHLNCTERRP